MSDNHKEDPYFVSLEAYENLQDEFEQLNNKYIELLADHKHYEEVFTKWNDNKKKQKEYSKKYRTSERGKEKQREISKRYYRNKKAKARKKSIQDKLAHMSNPDSDKYSDE